MRLTKGVNIFVPDFFDYKAQLSEDSKNISDSYGSDKLKHFQRMKEAHNHFRKLGKAKSLIGYFEKRVSCMLVLPVPRP